MAGYGSQGIAAFAEGIQNYGKEKKAVEVSDALVQIAKQMQMPDPSNPEKTIPALDKNFLQAYEHMSRSKKAGLQGYIKGQMDVAQGLQGVISRMGMAKQFDESGLSGATKMAQIEADQARTKQANVKTGQALGEIPIPVKPVPPPTGNAVMAEQRAQRKERFSQRKGIADELYNEKVNDPSILLDNSGIEYVTKGKVYGTNPADKTKATHVRLDDGGELLPIKKFNRLRKKAEEWQKLGTEESPQITPVPADVQTLLKSPTPQFKAMFDKHYGQGAADTIIAAQGGETPSRDTQDGGDE